MNSARRDLGGLGAQLRAGNTMLGVWCVIPSALSVEAVASLGFDWVLIDMQHGGMDYSTAVEMIRAAELAGVAPVVRVPWNEPGIIGRVLDGGAVGVVIPMIDDVASAKRAVAAGRYPPVGRRSFGPLRARARQGTAYRFEPDDGTLIIPMIETASGLEQAAAIAALPGIDALLVGPSDLSLALGLSPGDHDGQNLFDAAISTVIEACRGAGKSAAVFSNAGIAPRRISQGFRMVSLTTDIGALAAASAGILESVRKAAGPA
jgi:4-hydroxy-2-oxoheptanedioate aldolase